MEFGKVYWDSEIGHPGDPGDGPMWCSMPRCTNTPPRDQTKVIRHRKGDSTGGNWRWYCPEHHGRARRWRTDPPEPRA